MMDTKTAILFLASFAYLLCPSTGDFVLRIAHTNDVHARFENTSSNGGTCRGDEEGGCYGGVARRHTLMETLRQQAGPNLLFLDAGDQFQGTLWFVYYEGNATSHFMNLLQYDVMALGNHEFDNGVEGLRPFLQSVNFSVISANIDSSDEPLIDGLFTPSVIKVVDDQKIGIVGYTTKDTPHLVLPSGVANLKFNDEITKVQDEVTRLINEEGVDKIIAVGHAGYNLDKELAAAVEGVDVVVGGHTDTFLYTGTPPSDEVPAGEYPTEITQDSGAKVLVVQEYTFGKYLGYLEVTFNDAGEVINWEGNPILLNDSYEEDPDITAEIEIWKEPIFNLTQEVVGTSAVFLDGTRPSCRNYECNMGNMITDAIVFYFLELFGSTSSSWTNTSIAFWNGGGIRAPIAQGEFTVEDVLTTLPFGNMVEKVEITGQTLLEVLNHSISGYNISDPPGAFLQISGLRVQYDVSTSPYEVVDVQVRCSACVSPSYTKLEPERVYAVLTSNFLIDGGDGFEVLRDNVISRLPYDTVTSDIVMEYARKQSIIYAQTEARITFVDSSTSLTCGSSSLLSSFNLLTLFLVLSVIWTY